MESGGIVAKRGTNGTVDISNCYYLTGTHNGGINNTDETKKAEKKSAEEMMLESFVSLLNNGSNDNTWKKGNNYPILYWQ